MALASAYYVDADQSDDSGIGTSWETAKRHLYAALALINEPLTASVTIHIKSGTTQENTGDCEVRGIKCIGSGVELIVQPDTWNDANYSDGAHDPFGTTGTGTFDPTTATYPVTLKLKMEFEDCYGVVLKGLKFDGTDDEAGPRAMAKAAVTTQYCCLVGSNAMSLSMFDSLLYAENGYFSECNVGVVAIYNGQVQLVGDNTLNDCLVSGVHAAGNSLVVIRAWYEHPAHHTLDILTTSARIKKYAALRAVAGSSLCVQDESIHPSGYPFLAARVKVRDTSQALRPEYYGVALASQSLLTGADQITYTMKNANGDIVAMPSGQQVITDDAKSTVFD